MVMTLKEMLEQNQKKARQKCEHYKVRAALRPVLGTWHTITERAVKVRDGKEVRWESEPLEIKDHRKGKLVQDTPEYIAARTYTPMWSDGRHWELDEPVTSMKAMYIGYRFKFNGHWAEGTMDYEDGSGEDYFAQSETVEVWMFVTHANRNPIATFPFEIEVKQAENNKR